MERFSDTYPFIADPSYLTPHSIIVANHLICLSVSGTFFRLSQLARKLLTYAARVKSITTR